MIRPQTAMARDLDELQSLLTAASRRMDALGYPPGPAATRPQFDLTATGSRS